MSEERLSFKAWCIEQHRKTNHFYDKIIPYEYHLEMVVREIEHHLDIAKNDRNFNNTYPVTVLGFNPIVEREILIKGGWGHDIIEDTRNTYNDVISAGSGYEAAEIIYALTDDKGKDRAERGNDEHYKKLVKVPGAAFVKFCDRIANVKYSRFSGSSMFKKYEKENMKFMDRCYIPALEPYQLHQTLLNLFEPKRSWEI